MDNIISFLYGYAIGYFILFLLFGLFYFLFTQK